MMPGAKSLRDAYVSCMKRYYARNGARPALRHTRGSLRPTRFVGICAAADTLGCTREHLYHVMKGTRRSPRIEKWLKRNLKEAGK